MFESIKDEVGLFLKQYGMHHDSISLDSECETFIQDMNTGLEGKDSTLMMIPTYVSMDGMAANNKKVIVMDAGGTNFRVATVMIEADGSTVVEDLKVYPMPGTQGTLNNREFIDTIVGYLKPVINKSDRIGFCFSFPTEILPDLDGIVLGFNKEVSVTGIEGARLCKEISDTLSENGYPEKRFVLINDTVATLLAGQTFKKTKAYDSYIGFILGTGTNTCYIESVPYIKKIQPFGIQGSMVINMESGGYGKPNRGKLDRRFDKTTANPGEHIFEKMVSGAYMGGLLFTIVVQAVKDGLFSSGFAERFDKFGTFHLRDVNAFFWESSGGVLTELLQENDRDRLIFYQIADSLFERAAKLVTINLASILIKTGKGTDPKKPVCISAEGTTLYHLKPFLPKIEYHMKEFLNKRHKLYAEFVKVDNATLIGSAVAALLK